MGKGEIARYEQFLLFPQCFQKACFPGASKGVIVWEWVNVLDSSKLKEFADDNFKFDESGRKLTKSIENTEGKGEIACYKQFLLFPSAFERLVLQTNQGLFGKGLRNGTGFMYM